MAQKRGPIVYNPVDNGYVPLPPNRPNADIYRNHGYQPVRRSEEDLAYPALMYNKDDMQPGVISSRKDYEDERIQIRHLQLQKQLKKTLSGSGDYENDGRDVNIHGKLHRKAHSFAAYDRRIENGYTKYRPNDLLFDERKEYDNRYSNSAPYVGQDEYLQRKHSNNNPPFNVRTEFMERKHSSNKPPYNDQEEYSRRKYSNNNPPFNARTEHMERKHSSNKPPYNDQEEYSQRKYSNNNPPFNVRTEHMERKHSSNKPPYNDQEEFSQRKYSNNNPPFNVRTEHMERKHSSNKPPYNGLEEYSQRKYSNNNPPFNVSAGHVERKYSNNNPPYSALEEYSQRKYISNSQPYDHGQEEYLQRKYSDNNSPNDSPEEYSKRKYYHSNQPYAERREYTLGYISKDPAYTEEALLEAKHSNNYEAYHRSQEQIVGRKYSGHSYLYGDKKSSMNGNYGTDLDKHGSNDNKNRRYIDDYRSSGNKTGNGSSTHADNSFSLSSTSEKKSDEDSKNLVNMVHAIQLDVTYNKQVEHGGSLAVLPETKHLRSSSLLKLGRAPSSTHSNEDSGIKKYPIAENKSPPPVKPKPKRMFSFTEDEVDVYPQPVPELIKLCEILLKKLRSLHETKNEMNELNAILELLRDSLKRSVMDIRKPSLTESIASALNSFSFLGGDEEDESFHDTLTVPDESVAIPIIAYHLDICNRALVHHLLSLHDLIIGFPPPNGPLNEMEKKYYNKICQQKCIIDQINQLISIPCNIDVQYVCEKFCVSEDLSYLWSICVSGDQPLFCTTKTLIEALKARYEELMSAEKTDELKQKLVFKEEVCENVVHEVCQSSVYSTDKKIFTVFQFVDFFKVELKSPDLAAYMNQILQQVMVMKVLESKDDLVVMSALQQYKRIPIIKCCIQKLLLFLAAEKLSRKGASLNSLRKLYEQMDTRSEMADIMITSLEEQNVKIKTGACIALGKLKVRGISKKLIHLFQTEKGIVKDAAMIALKDLGHTHIRK